MKYIFFCFVIILTIASCKKTPSHSTPAVRDGYLEINGSQVYYKIIGSGPPIIMIHGGPLLDHSYMLPSFESLAKNYQLVFYDQRVCGRSSIEVDTATMSMKGFIDDIELLRKALKLDKIVVMGHSWGGLLAMHYAIMYPQNLKSLILSNSIPPSSIEWLEEQTIVGKLVSEEDKNIRVEILNSAEMKSNPSIAIQKLLKLSFKAQFSNQKYLDSLSLFIPDNYLERSGIFQRLGSDLVSFDLYEDLKELNVPSLILFGEDEPAANLSSKNMVSNIPNAELILIKQSGHFPFIEQPQTYFSSIENFLNK